MTSTADKYIEALLEKPNDPSLLTALGQIYYEEEKIDEAETQFRKALDSDYQYPAALKALGILLQEKKELVDAMYVYLRYLELEPRDALVCSNLGATFHNLGEYESALEYYRRAEKEDPKDFLFKKNQALSLLALGRVDDARDKLQEARTLAPDDAEINRLLGSVFAQKSDLPKALEFYEFALKKDPQDADAHFEFAIVLRDLNRLSDAIYHAQVAADLFLKVCDTERTARAYWELGWNYYLVGEWESSLQADTKALQFDPKLSAVYFDLGLALLQLGRYSEAIKRYEDGIQNLSELVDLKYYAIYDLKNALDKNPQLTGGVEILEMLQEKYNAGSANIEKSVRSATS